jgi:hypothetical protein
MSGVKTITRVLDSELLCADLIIVPVSGATPAAIADEETKLGRRISPKHRALLEQWNGLGLEVIRFFGCGDETGEIGRLADFQIDVASGIEGALVIGSDASGFVYLEASDGRVVSFDTDGGTVKEIARDIDDFIDRVIFGADASQFAGHDWLEEIRDCGLL